jgi:myxalamid-type polyketide synthase MxaE and MxaD
LSRSHPLDYFVLFSSTTALWGASGLAHYAAANAFLDALAQQRHSQHLAATVVDWGTWQQLNALSSIEQDRAIRAGMRPMAASTALRALDVILSAGMCHAIVADIDWSLFKSVYEARRQRPLLERLASESAPDLAAKQATSDAFVDRLARTMRDERREMLAQHVSQRLTGVLGSAAGDAIDRRRGFFDLGMDSITSIQLRRQLERDLRRSLPSTLTFNYSNIDLLTDFLLGELFPSVRDAAPPAPLEDIGDLDDDSTEQELFDQLAARLMAEQKR